MANPLDGLSYWLRQGGDLRSLARPADQQLIDFVREHAGTTTLTHKVMDGLTWQGQIDPETAFRNLDECSALASYWTKAGGRFVPVVVPRGLRREAQAHAEVARFFGTLVLDLEPYDGFWDKAPTEQAPVYLRELRRDAPDAYLVLQADPRRFWDTGGFTIPEVAPYVNTFMNQHYVGWTEVGWRGALAEAERFWSIQRTARKANADLEMYATLWGYGDLSEAVAFGRLIAGDCYGFNVFALGAYRTMTLQQLHSIRDARFTFKQREAKPPLPSPPDHSPEAARLAEMHKWALRDEIGARIRREYVEAELVRLGSDIPRWDTDDLTEAA